MDKSLLTVEWKMSDLESALRVAGIETGEDAVHRLLSPDRKLLSRIEEAVYACGWKIIYEEAVKLTDKGEESLLKESWIEIQEQADFMVKLERSNMWEDGVKIYQKYGETEKNIDCLKEHLNRDSKTYLELTLCYDSLENYEAAEETCRLALEKCKENLTVFLYLIRSVYKRQDNATAKKLISRAKLRKSVDMDRLMEALKEDHGLGKNS